MASSPKKKKLEPNLFKYGFFRRSVQQQCHDDNSVTEEGSVPDQSPVSVPDQLASVPDQSASVPDQSPVSVSDQSPVSVTNQSASVPDQSASVPNQWPVSVPDQSAVSGSDSQKQSQVRDSPAACPGSCTVSQGEQLLREYFHQECGIHNYYICDKTCRTISDKEKQRLRETKQPRTDKQMKRAVEIFKHQWLTDPETSFCEKTGIWWLVYVEGEGMYCLLCRIHNTKNKFNKSSVFNQVPSTNSSKHNAISDHAKTVGHIKTLACELDRKNSTLAQQYKEIKETKDVVTFNAFQGCYWLGKEEVANRKLLSLIGLQKRSGVKEMTHFKQTSERSQKEMRLLTGQLIKNNLLDQVYSAKWFSVLVDEVTDCASVEQLLIYVGYVDVRGDSHFKFLDCVDVLADSHSADAATITKCIMNELEASKLNVQHLCGFGSDGASVMTGDKKGVGARLQEHAKSMLRTHCISHRLALACGDANDRVKYIAVVETILCQLWKWLEYPKRAAAFVKVVTSLQNMDISSKPNKYKKLSKKVQKACRTRWLSTGKSVSSVCTNFVALMMTLRDFKDMDATAHGLLTRMNNVKFLGTILLLNQILPHLNSLCKLFQKDHTCYASIKPQLASTKASLNNIEETFNVVDEVERNIQPGGPMAELELSMSAEDPNRGFLTSLKTSYTQALQENLDRRFPEAPTLMAFKIFDPTTLPKKTDSSFTTHGNDDIAVLCKQFNFDTEETEAEWLNFKYQMTEFDIPDDVLKGKTISPTHFVMKKLVREQASFTVGFQNLVELAQICLSQPMSTAVVERGASAVKRLKTRLRSSMKNEMLSSLLHITTNGPQQESDDARKLLTEATTIWRARHVRNLPKVGGSDHSMNAIPITGTATSTSEASVQTECEASEQTESQGMDVDEKEDDLVFDMNDDTVDDYLGDSESDAGYDSDF